MKIDNKLIMRTKTFFFLLTLSITLSGCSWTEYFLVKNYSEETITVIYQITDPKGNDFPIFNNKVVAYELTKKGTLNWDKKLEINDLNASELTIKVKLPPDNALVFGSLNNDHYINTDQKFINGRAFNFSMMEIEKGAKLTRITKASFDEFFKKDKGQIMHEIR